MCFKQIYFRNTFSPGNPFNDGIVIISVHHKGIQCMLQDFKKQKKDLGKQRLNVQSLPCFLLLPCHPVNQAGEDCVAELPWEEEVVQHLLPLHLLPLHSSACLKRMTLRECHCSAPRSDPSVNKIKTFKFC